MRPSSLTSPGAVLVHRIGPASPDQGPDTPAPVDCCDTDEANVPDRAAERIPFSLGLTTGDTEDLNETEGTVTDGAGEKTFANPTNANDGNLVTVASIASYATGTAPDDGYLVSQLAAPREVSSMLIIGDSECQASHDWEVYSSDDGVSWTTVPFSYTYTHVSPGQPDEHLLSFDDPVTAEYWRIRWRRLINGFSCGVDIHTWSIYGSTVVDTAWSVLESKIVDGDDATYEDTEGDDWAGEHLRFDLGGEFRIVRTRIRLGTTSAGSKTLTLYGWNELDQSDIETVTTITFVGTGSLTAQEVTKTWYTDSSFRYWQIDGPAEVIRWYTIELYEPTAAQSHQHESIDPDAVMEAGRWELAVIPGSPPDSLYADGDWLYIWVPGA